MSDEQQIERDLREYLDKEPNLRKADRLAYLQAIYNKHLEMNKLDHMVTNNDVFSIISGAKRQFTIMTMPVRISRKELDGKEAVHIALLESFILYLNKNNLLRKLVKFDFTE